MGRPRKPIDARQVEKLAAFGCSVKEVAEFFACCPDTVRNRFSAELDKGQTSLRIRLRRRQLKAAMAGNIAMLIWLGKQYLGQTDKVEQVGAEGIRFISKDAAQRREHLIAALRGIDAEPAATEGNGNGSGNGNGHV